MINTKLLLDKIEEFNSIVIYRHENPDVDACGSQFGLKRWIEENYPDKKVYALGEQTCSQIEFPDNDLETKDIVKISLAILLDTADLKRCDGLYFEDASYLVKIDHHPNNEPYGSLQIVDTKFAATCEILATIFSKLEGKTLSKEVAEYLYSGLLTDTLCFRTTNTTANTLKTASYLAEKELNIAELNRILFDESLDNFMFGTFIRQNIQLINNKIAYIVLSKDTLESYHIDPSQARAMIDVIGHVKEFQIWAIFTEDSNFDGTSIYSGSLRSKTIAVNDVARIYGGGGHLNAAGVKNLSYKQVFEILKIFEQKI